MWLCFSFQAKFADVLRNEEAILAAVTPPKFKLRWLRSQELKDKAKASLLSSKNHSQVPAHFHITQIQPKRTISFPLRRMRRTPPLQQKTRWQTILDLQHKTSSLCADFLSPSKFHHVTMLLFHLVHLLRDCSAWASLSSLRRGTDCQTKDLKSFSSYIKTTGLVVRWEEYFSID